MTKKIINSSGVAWKYGYNNRNQLTSVDKWSEDPDTYGTAVRQMEADYQYDALGNRNQKTVDAEGAGAGSAVVTRYALEGWNPAKSNPVGTENFDVWAVLDGSSSLTSRYIDGDRVDQHLGYVTGGNAYWYLTDHLGSTRKVLDNSATVKDAIVYDAFGNIVSETDSAFRGLYSNTGREYDEESKLQFNRARYYDPLTARWISQDPLGFDAGDSNLYRYLNNRQTKATDPSGLQEGIRSYIDNEGRRRIVDESDYLDVLRYKASLLKASLNKQTLLQLYRKKAKIEESLTYALLADGGYFLSKNINRLKRMGWAVLKEAPNQKDGFQYRIFSHQKDGRVVISFGGTDADSLGGFLADMQHNLSQGTIGASSQYRRAIDLARSIKSNFGTKKIELVGHSLGGGLASAAGIVNDLPVVAFNAAGVHSLTVAPFGLERADRLIRVFRVERELLTTLQDANWMIFLPPPFFSPIPYLMPDSVGKTVWLARHRSVGDPLSAHKMDGIIKSFDQELNAVNGQIRALRPRAKTFVGPP
jgi:RHS repeat-associated protein